MVIDLFFRRFQRECNINFRKGSFTSVQEILALIDFCNLPWRKNWDILQKYQIDSKFNPIDSKLNFKFIFYPFDFKLTLTFIYSSNFCPFKWSWCLTRPLFVKGRMSDSQQCPSNLWLIKDEQGLKPLIIYTVTLVIDKHFVSKLFYI